MVRGRDGRVAEGARLESVFTRKGNVGSNPTLSASLFAFNELSAIHTVVHTVKPIPHISVGVDRMRETLGRCESKWNHSCVRFADSANLP